MICFGNIFCNFVCFDAVVDHERNGPFGQTSFAQNGVLCCVVFTQRFVNNQVWFISCLIQCVCGLGVVDVGKLLHSTCRSCCS